MGEQRQGQNDPNKTGTQQGDTGDKNRQTNKDDQATRETKPRTGENADQSSQTGGTQEGKR
jgi:hypothetical protein